MPNSPKKLLFEMTTLFAIVQLGAFSGVSLTQQQKRDQMLSQKAST